MPGAPSFPRNPGSPFGPGIPVGPGKPAMCTRVNVMLAHVCVMLALHTCWCASAAPVDAWMRACRVWV
jgi:hypothetical protein